MWSRTRSRDDDGGEGEARYGRSSWCYPVCWLPHAAAVNEKMLELTADGL